MPNTACRSRTTSTRARNSRCARWCSPIPSSPCCGRKEPGWPLLLGAIALSFVVNMAVRHRVADGAGHDADHAGGVRAAAPEMAKHRRHCIAWWPFWAALAWAASPQLRVTTDTLLAGLSNSTRSTMTRRRSACGWNIWQKSLRFFAEAPIIGHGTGSTRGLFEQAAIGPGRRRRPRSSAIRTTRR